MDQSEKQCMDLVRMLRAARRLLVMTGAGISTGSGLPDFRGPNGVWRRRQPVYYEDFMSSEAARVEHWDYKLEGWPAFREARPNAIHQALVTLERAGRLGMVVTQNIDGLHGQAGTSADRLVELHGTNLLVECQSCGERSDPGPHFAAFARTRCPPLCACGGYLKPATVSFGQALPEAEWSRACAAADEADAVLALGSSLTVYPAAEIPLRAARRGIPYGVINAGPTGHDHLSSLTWRLEGKIEDLFPAAVARALAGSQDAPAD